jgi:hypothetical protein
MAIIGLYRKAPQAKISLTRVVLSVTLAESNAAKVYIAALVLNTRGVSGPAIAVGSKPRDSAGPRGSESESGQVLYRSRLLPPGFEGRPQHYRRDLDSGSQLRAPVRRNGGPLDPGAVRDRTGRPVVRALPANGPVGPRSSGFCSGRRLRRVALPASTSHLLASLFSF